MVDDGSGTKEVFRIVNNKLTPVPAHEIGKLYGGDCYVISYSYGTGGSQNNIIYYWLVNKSISQYIYKVK